MKIYPLRSLRLLPPLLALLLAGCVSARYQSAPKNNRPAVPLEFAATTATTSLTLHTVIIYRGPGSWKRDAYWDEYVVLLANPGDTPLTVEAAVLTDFQDTAVPSGLSPWLLEKESRTFEARLASSLGTTLKIGGGLMVASLPAAGVLMAGMSGAAISGAAVTVTSALLPLYLVGTVYRNVSNRHRIEAEFNRRRLPLPLTLAPGETVAGSVFFRISPGPKKLAFTGRTGDGETLTLSLGLAPLAGLHLQADQDSSR